MNDNKTNINWLITINLNPYGNPYKISVYNNLINCEINNNINKTV